MALYYVYILECSDGTLYVGQTSNVRERLEKHAMGLVRWTKSRLPARLVYFEEFATRKDAMRREWDLKTKWNTDRKEKLIQTFDPEKVTKLMRL